MRLEFSEINNQSQWNNTVASRNFFSFLQTYEWGEAQKAIGNGIFRIFGKDGEKIVLIAQLIKVKSKRSVFLLCPHGPMLFEENIEEIMKQFTDFLKNIATKHNVDFARLNSLLPNNKKNLLLLKKLGWRFSPMHQHAETTWLLDLTQEDDELMKNMRKTTRYLIKRSLKEGVIIKKDNSTEAIEQFIVLHRKHAKLNRYEPFKAEFIKYLFKYFSKNKISLKFALYEGKIEAASVIILTPPQAAYYLAVSNTTRRQFSPAYFLQWQSILEAKQNGCSTYNFWGISPDDNPKHPLCGVSLFKRGFGGYKMDFLHAHDLPITKKYWLNYVIETARRIKRGYYYLKPKK